ncbi:MAG: IMP dehydrogenase [Deltaproteobacteria bacterium]|jgi:IMP dehydrogenase|nr:IMP dehydrogenase [Deltaproteobacteria bacterium]
MNQNNFTHALTFDDILLLPAFSRVLPSQTKTDTRITKKLKLKIPFISAAMDTVTEWEMAVAMARMGGMGIVHKNLSPEHQAGQVKKVKKYETWMISNPITVSPDDKVSRARALMRKHSISGLPVINNKGFPVGIITIRDIRFETDSSRQVSSLMTTGLITASQGVSMQEAKGLLHCNRIEKLVVLREDMKMAGLITLKDLQNAQKYPDAAKDDKGRLLVGAAVGIGDKEKVRAEKLVEAGVDLLVVDTAHGHSEGVGQMVEWIKSRYSSLQVVAGNIATAEAAVYLIEKGVDALKVGIGPGSICTTRMVAGVGVPQLTALDWVCNIARKHDVPVIADGGIKFSGDVVKALAIGADTVMMGSMFAGTDETPGDVVLYQGRSYKQYRGMGSLGAMKAGSADRYFQDQSESSKLVPEGIEGRVPFKGSVKQTLQQLVGGLRSGMGYLGADNLESLRKNAKMVRISSSGLKESHVHDVIITKQAPNYNPN